MGIPKEPRQIMINLMYLVLTALLALNVSNEILNAFRVLTDSINKSNSSIDNKTTAVYDQIVANEKAPGKFEKVHPFKVKADSVKKAADSMVVYLGQWRDRVIAAAGGWDRDSSQEKGVWEKDSTPTRMDNIDATTNLLVDNKGGDTLRNKLRELRKYFLGIVNPKDAADIRPLMSLKVDTNVKPTDNNPTGNWSRGYFEHMPAIAACALLAKFQNDVRSSEALVINTLYDEAHLTDIKFDTITAIAVPKTTYALEGDKIEASILLAAFNKSNKPIVTVTQGGGSHKDAVNGIVPWETLAHGTGLQTVKGNIVLNTENGTITRPWTFDYVVGTTGASLQLDKMNVFYIGVPNPVTVSAAGYSVEDVSLKLPSSASQNPGTAGKGHFDITVTQAGKIDVDIMAKSKDKNGAPIKVSTIPIRVKYIPDPVAKVGGKSGGTMSAASFRVQIAPAAELKDFDFDARFQVVSFSYSMLPKGKEYQGPYIVNNANGCRFTDNASITKLMDKARPGDKVFIEDIKAIGPDKRPRTLSTIILTLN